MPDNLTVSIVGDTSKLVRAFAIARKELQDFNRELKKAVDANDAARIDEFSQKVDVASRTFRRLGEQVRAAHRSIAESSPWARVGEQVGEFRRRFGELGQAFNEFADKTIPHWREVVTIGFAAATIEIGRFVKEGVEAVNGLKDQSEALGVSSRYVETYRAAFAKAGVAVEDADKAFARITKSLAEQREELYKSGQASLSRTTTLRGSEGGALGQVQVYRGAEEAIKGVNTELSTTMRIIRGGVKDVTDFSNAWKTFGVDISKFGRDERGTEGAIAALVRGFDEMSKIDPGFAAAKIADFLGKDWPALIGAMRDFPNLSKEVQAEIAKSFGYVTQGMQNDAAKAKVAWIEVGLAFESIRKELGAAVAPAITQLFKTISGTINQNAGAIKEWAADVGRQAQLVVSDLIKVFNNPQIDGNQFESRLGPVISFFQRLINEWIPRTEAVLSGFMKTLNSLAESFNSIFGTNVQGQDITIVLVLGQLTGAFNLLAAAISLIITLGAPLVGLLGVDGLIVVGITAVLGVLVSLDGGWKALADTVTSVIKTIGDSLSWLWTQMGNVGSAVGGAISGAIRDFQNIGPGSRMASGGVVPGHGTGDVVPAMLTPGEFVNRLSSVRYYGADLFRALNARAIPRSMFRGYAMGGLVDRLHAPVSGFAEGGLVGAAAGTAVHLHLDGQSFMTRADDVTAQNLMVASRRYQMRSAGVKPSWYGGRPGG